MDSVELISVVILFIIYFILLLSVFNKLLSGQFSVAVPVVLVLFIFFIMPIIMNITIGKANYRSYPGFAISEKDVNISIIYNFYLSFVGLLFYFYIKKNSYIIKTNSQDKLITKLLKLKGWLWLLLILPTIAVIIVSPNPTAYVAYKEILNNENETFRIAHVIIARFCVFGILASSLLFYIIKNGRFTGIVLRYFFYFLFTLIIIWVFGKRSIVAEYIICILTLGWLLGFLKGFKLMRRSIIYFAILVVFIVGYGKGVYENDSDQTYTSTRINFGRDQTVKFVLFSEFVSERPILEYRGQSFLFDMVFYVPRSIWPGKPYPYAVYFTTSVFNVPPLPMGWGFTTSILDEGIANFGIVGFLFAPLFLLWLCKKGDRAESVITKGLGVLVVSLLLVLHLAAFLPVFITYLFLLIRDHKRRKKPLYAYKKISL